MSEDRLEGDRCPHGVWAGDHCWKCDDESTDGRYWLCVRCGYRHTDPQLDLQNPPCPCGDKSIWQVANEDADAR